VRDNDELLPVGHYKDARTGKYVLVSEKYSYDRATQVSGITWFYKTGRGRAVPRKLNMRCFYPAELEALLHYNGFTITARYGDFDRRPFRSNHQKQIIICRGRSLVS
jgi:hypothetical protein